MGVTLGQICWRLGMALNGMPAGLEFALLEYLISILLYRVCC